jgi:type IX secretion system PorP/SprF family membrane protein
VANYRMQYFTLQSPSPYNTLSASADFGLFRNQLRGDIFGIGLMVANDRQTAIKSNQLYLSLAYHKGMGKNKRHYLSAGAQIGFLQRRIDLNNLYFADQFDQNNYTFSLQTQELANFTTDKYIKMNVNLGLFWSSNFTKYISGYAGVSFFNIVQPQETFFAADNERKFRYNAHLGMIFQIKKLMLISPNAMFMQQSKFMQWIVGSSFGFNLSGSTEPFNTVISVGAWYDGNGALIASTGFQFSGFQVGVSYDATIQKDLTKATKSVGAVELSLIYVGKPVERTKQYQPLFCPKF